MPETNITASACAQHTPPRATQVVYRYARVLAVAARADAYMSRALAVEDPVAYGMAAKGAEAGWSITILVLSPSWRC